MWELVFKQVKGYLFYYGVASIQDLYAWLQLDLPDPMAQMELPQLKSRLQKEADHPDSLYDFEMKGDILWHIDVDDYRWVRKEQAAREQVGYRPVSPLEIKSLAEDREEELWGNAAQEFRCWLEQQAQFEPEIAVAATGDYVTAMRNNVKVTELLPLLSMEIGMQDVSELDHLVDTLNRIWNEIPRWELKGWSSQEVYQRWEKPQLRSLPAEPFHLEPGPTGGSKSTPTPAPKSGKIGRNDPCPCGSGRKYKQCCLNRQSVSELQAVQVKQSLGSRAADLPGRLETYDQAPYADTRALLEAFLEFTALAPWRWMSDIDLFAVEFSPQSVNYGAVMGWGGEVFGLAVYPGQEGLRYYNAQRNSCGDPQELDMHEVGPLLLLVLGDREELHPKERRVYAELGYKFRGANAWPVLRRYEPGCYPWKLSLTDMRMATAMLRQAAAVALHCEAHRRQWLNRIEIKGQLAWCKVGTSAEDLGKQLKWRQFPPIAPPFNTFDEVRSASLVKTLPRRASVWEMDCFYGDDPIQDDPSQIPWFPLYTVVADAHTGMLKHWQIDDFQALASGNLVLDLLTKVGYIPATLVLYANSPANQLVPILECLAIEVRTANKLSTDELKHYILAGPPHNPRGPGG